MSKNDIAKIESELKSGKKMVAMLAPSFVIEFDYPSIIHQLKKLGFDKVVELTFGAKMINREYHKLLESDRELLISSACAGIVECVKQKYHQYKKNLIGVDSPMSATGKICRKTYPKHKIVFISPCHAKKIEAENSASVDYVIDYQQLKELFKKYNIKESKEKAIFDKFYSDFTKIFPLAGGLSRTAHVKGVLKKGEERIIDGIEEFEEFMKKPEKGVRFLDATFCPGGCIGGPCTSKELGTEEKKEKIMHYLEIAKHEDIPKPREGLVKRAEGISFRR